MYLGKSIIRTASAATRISLWPDDCISGCAKEGSAICMVAKLNAPLMCLVDEIIVEMFELCKRTFAAVCSCVNFVFTPLKYVVGFTRGSPTADKEPKMSGINTLVKYNCLGFRV